MYCWIIRNLATKLNDNAWHSREKITVVQLLKEFVTSKIKPVWSITYSNTPIFRPNQHYMNPVQYHKTQLLLHEPNRKKEFTPEQATKAQRGTRGKAVLFELGAGWGGR